MRILWQYDGDVGTLAITPSIGAGFSALGGASTSSASSNRNVLSFLMPSLTLCTSSPRLAYRENVLGAARFPSVATDWGSIELGKSVLPPRECERRRARERSAHPARRQLRDGDPLIAAKLARVSRSMCRLLEDLMRWSLTLRKTQVEQIERRMSSLCRKAVRSSVWAAPQGA